MKMQPRTLLQFLKEARHAHLQFLSTTPPPTSPIYVLGNPSVDLDSIISAIVYSYFAHNHPKLTSSTSVPRQHVPLINLANVSAGPELRRLRPEFVKALWLCTAGRGSEDEGSVEWEDTQESAGDVLRECIVTVQDFATQLRDIQRQKEEKCVLDAILVDWNALPIRTPSQTGHGSIDGLAGVVFHVLGCIDHHIDEGFLPSPSNQEQQAQQQPHLIQPAGSCTSHVVNHLRKQSLWTNRGPDGALACAEAQIAQLALGPILIDTANLTATEKVTDADTDAFAFLASKVNLNYNSLLAGGDRSAAQVNDNVTPFYTQVLAAKQNSLNLLTVDEILVRDYKSWTEKRDSRPVKLGFCSTVKSLPWIIHKAGNTESLLTSLRTLCKNEDLDVVIIMTAFTSPSKGGQFCRELLICVANDADRAESLGLDTFVDQAVSKLGLGDWTPLDNDSYGHGVSIQEVQSTLNTDTPAWRRLWVQSNLGMSRKQVAPLLRSAVAGM